MYDGPTALDDATLSCDGPVLEMNGSTIGWADGGFLILQDGEGRTEEHDVDDTQFGQCADWCLIERSVATETVWARNESSAMGCDDALTWAVGVFDVDGNLADCQVFGADPQALLDSGAIPVFADCTIAAAR